MRYIFRKQLSVLVLATIVASFLPTLAQTNRNINRVRPPEGTPQFAEEAARVQLEEMGSRIGLSDVQLLQMRKAQQQRSKKLKAQQEKLEKSYQKYTKEKAKIEAEESRIYEAYEREVSKILTPSQLNAYRMIQIQEAKENALKEFEKTSIKDSIRQPEIIKADIPLMYE